MQGLGLLSLRCVVGLVCIAHGLPRLFLMGGGSPRDAAVFFEAAGLSSAFALTVGTGIVEVLAGALLVAGAHTFWLGLLLAATNVAVGWRLNVPNGFFLNWSLEPGVWHGYEFVLVLVAARDRVRDAGRSRDLRGRPAPRTRRRDIEVEQGETEGGETVGLRFLYPETA